LKSEIDPKYQVGLGAEWTLSRTTSDTAWQRKKDGLVETKVLIHDRQEMRLRFGGKIPEGYENSISPTLYILRVTSFPECIP
jgi:hypothetical protein